MAFVVLYDANVLYPSTLRDLFIRVGQAELVHARWTDDILDEVFRNLIVNRPDLDTQRLARTRKLMNRAVRDSAAVQRIADSRERPPASFADVLAMLERDGLVESSAALRQ